MRVDKTKWVIRILCNVTEIQMGQSPESTSYNNKGEGLPFYQGNRDFGIINPTPRIFCSKPLKIAGVGDLLISVRAPIGAINIASSLCCIGRGLASIKSIDNKSCIAYLRHLLISKRGELNNKGTGSTFKAINKNILNNLKIYIPPLQIQQGIATELDAIQTMIDGYKAQIADLDELAKSIFLDLFGDPIKNEKGWTRKTFGDACNIISGKDHKAVNDLNGKYPIYGSGGIMGKANKYICEAGTTIIGRKGTINSPIFVNEKFWNIDTAFGLSPKENIHAQYLFFFCKSFDFKKIQSGAAIPSLTRKDILKQSFLFPPLALQQQFATQVESIEKQKELYKSQLKDAEQLMAERMQYYFS